MQRVHMDDLTGFVLAQSDEWTVLNLPAIAEAAGTSVLPKGKSYHRAAGRVLAPEREPLEVSRDSAQPARLGSVFGAVSAGAGAARRRHDQTALGATLTRTCLTHNVRPQSWDTASKGGPDNDWSVCTTWLMSSSSVNGTCWIVWRGRVDYPALKAKVDELPHKWGVKQVLVEESGTAIGLLRS